MGSCEWHLGVAEPTLFDSDFLSCLFFLRLQLVNTTNQQEYSKGHDQETYHGVKENTVTDGDRSSLLGGS
jgi:hypothetical protein